MANARLPIQTLQWGKLMSLSLLICQQAFAPGNGKKSWYDDHFSSWLSTSLADKKNQ